MSLICSRLPPPERELCAIAAKQASALTLLVALALLQFQNKLCHFSLS